MRLLRRKKTLLATTTFLTPQSNLTFKLNQYTLWLFMKFCLV